jgi:hypothetical protein
MTLLSKKQHLLEEKILRAMRLHPKRFDERLGKGLLHFIAKKENSFFDSRSLTHLFKIMLAQFFLQKQMERVMGEKVQADKEVFARIFSASKRICFALVFTREGHVETFNQDHLVKAIETFVPGVKEIPDSFFKWQSLKHPYLFCYLELETPRGKILSQGELKKLQKDLAEHLLHCTGSSCPYVFSPYNYEESYRQLLLLQRELKSPEDLPQISVHFKGQTSSDLEFLVYVVRPETELSLEDAMKRLPPFVRISSHTNQYCNTAPRSEASAFSLHVPIRCLEAGPVINQFKARKYIVALLERVIGPFRDLNGGLLAKQDEAFEKITKELREKIPQYPFFAESLFYSLKPVEAQITLRIDQAELLFRAFAATLKEKKSFFVRHEPKGVLIVKTKNGALLEPLIQKIKKRKNAAYASIKVLEAQYLIHLDLTTLHATDLEQELVTLSRQMKSKPQRFLGRHELVF